MTTTTQTTTFRPTAVTPDRSAAGNTQMRDVLATLERGIATTLTGDGFARYLRAMSRFPTYSPNNIALIWTSLARQ